MKNNTVLEIQGVEKSFPGVRALINMNIDLRQAEVHAICGENGAGKSTLMKIIAGVYKPDRGRILLNGRELTARDPNDAHAQGIAVIFQETSLFPELTVLENLFIGHELMKPLAGCIRRLQVLDYRAMRKKATDLFNHLGMRVDLDAKVSDLGVAAKQMVEIAKALTYESRILILDEPTAALTSKEVATLFEIIEKLKSHGVSMLYISHRLDEIFQVADRVTVIRDGEHVQTAAVKDVSKDQLVAWMVGRSLTNLYPKEEVEIGGTVLEARNISRDNVLFGVDLAVRKGEILGLAGLSGAGRTELALALCGLAPPDSGELFLEGRKVKANSYRQAMALGMVYISEDRHKYGLIVPMTIKENITMPMLKKISNAIGLIDAREENLISGTYMQSLAIRAPTGDAVVNNLSGGNQQKVCVAKALAGNPRILILDEPTRGVDVGAKSEVHKIISALAGSGKSIIIISSDLPEILGMCDRVVVMKAGRKVGELLRHELSQEKILSMAL